MRMLLALAVGKLAQATFTSKIVVVIVPVVVTDDAGRTVTGLTRDRFHIFDEGREQPIATFAFGDSPVTLGLVLDGSASMRLELASAASSAIGRTSGSSTSSCSRPPALQPRAPYGSSE